MKKSKFWGGLVPESFSFIKGVNETTLDKGLINAHSRSVDASTDYADGVSFRKQGVSTDGLGFARLPYDGTSIYSGYGRGMGIFQLYGQSKNFTTYFSEIFPKSGSLTQSVSTLDQWAYLSTTKQNLASFTGPSFNLVGTQLPCHDFNNLIDVFTDNQYFWGIWNIQLASNTAFALFGQNYGTVTDLNGPAGVALDSTGNVYVANDNANIVNVFYPLGAPITTFGSLTTPSGIAVSANGNIIVVATNSKNVNIYNSSMVLQSTFGSAGSGNGQFNVPLGVATDSSNNIYVCDRSNGRIQKFNSAGTYVAQVALTAANMICIDSSNVLYVTSLSLNTVSIYNSSLVLQSSFGSGGSGNGQFSAPYGIAVDSSPHLYVADSANTRVQVFTTAGAYVSQFGTSGTGLGQFSLPYGVAVNQNYLYVTDLTNNNVQIFTNQHGSYAPIIQQGAVPTIDTGNAGALNGYYAWCYTMVDAALNESQPSPLVASGQMVNNNCVISIAVGANVTVGVWQKIRIYRTLTNTSAVLATGNPTFYHVPGLDITVTSSTSYSTTDNIDDSVLQLPTNYQMNNVGYINGALAALSVSAVPQFVVNWNGQTWGANWNVSGTQYPLRVFWSAASDNSQASSGNGTSWNSFDFLDIGTTTDGNIIGMFPGLQGRLYIFKEYATYIIQPTGNTLLPYSATSISSEFGLYHHSIAEIGGAIIGRTKDNIMIFNGASYRNAGASPLIRETISRCITPEADSGVYDTNDQRYYLAVCDSRYNNMFQTEVNYGANIPKTSVINCLRNETIVFDIPSSTFEIHAKTPIQVMRRLKDNSGREKIFALGLSSDVLIFIDGNFFGSAFSFIGTVANAAGTAIKTTNVVTGSLSNICLSGNFVAVPFMVNADGVMQFTDFVTNNSIGQNSNGPNLQVSFFNRCPTNDNKIAMMTIVGNSSDTVASIASNVITTTNNLYSPICSNNYAIYDLTQNKFFGEIDGGFQVGNTSKKLSPINQVPSPAPVAGDQIILVPNRCYQVTPGSSSLIVQNMVPYNMVVTPPFGIKNDDKSRKSFQEFRLFIKGSGTLNIYGFKDGNSTYDLGPALCTPDESHSFSINSNSTTNTTASQSGNVGSGTASQPNFYQQLVHLNGLVCYYERFMIWMVRGSGWFEIQDITAYSREMEQLADN